MRPEYAAALPNWLDIATFMRDARTAINQSVMKATADTPSLYECVTRSVLGALMTCAQLGLRPEVNGECGLRVRWSGRHQVHVAVFETGYTGLIKLAYLSGAVKLIYAQEVYAEDVFDIEYGSHHHLSHRPADLDDPGPIRCFYGFAKLPNGECVFDYWRNSRMEAHRDRYAASKGGPWFQPETYPAMGRKTMIKQLAKLLPVTGTLFAEAVAADAAVRMDPTPTTRPEQAAEHDDTPEAARASAHAGAPVRDTIPPDQEKPAPPVPATTPNGLTPQEAPGGNHPEA